MKTVLAVLVLAGQMAFAGKPATKEVTLTPSNTVTMRGPIFDDLVRKTELKLAELAIKRGAANYPIYLVIDSPGGSIFSGLEFIEFTRSIKNLHTITLFAASMASGIQQAIPGERLITETGVDMFHRAAGGFQGQFEDGEVESQLAFVKSIVRSMEITSSKRIGISLLSYKAKVKDEWWMFGQQAVDAGVADALVVVNCSKELLEQHDITVVQTLFFSVRLDFSGCPMIRAGQPLTKEDAEQLSKNAKYLDHLTKRYFRML